MPQRPPCRPMHGRSGVASDTAHDASSVELAWDFGLQQWIRFGGGSHHSGSD